MNIALKDGGVFRYVRNLPVGAVTELVDGTIVSDGCAPPICEKKTYVITIEEKQQQYRKNRQIWQKSRSYFRISVVHNTYNLTFTILF